MIAHFLQQMAMYSIGLAPFYIAGRTLYMRKRAVSWLRELVLLAFAVFCISIFSQTIIPEWTIQVGRLQLVPQIRSDNFVLFETIRLYAQQLQGPRALIAFYNLAGNVLLFVPFGIFLPLLWPRFRPVHYALGVALFIPLFIEVTQYFIGRSADVDDVLLNAIGILIGYFIWSSVSFFKLQVKKVVTTSRRLLK